MIPERCLECINFQCNINQQIWWCGVGETMILGTSSQICPKFKLKPTYTITSTATALKITPSFESIEVYKKK